MYRYEVLRNLLKDRNHEVGCEVGVNVGTTTEYLLNKLAGIKRYYVVDPWKSYEIDGVGMYHGPAKKKKTKKGIREEWYSMIRRFLEATAKHSHKVVS